MTAVRVVTFIGGLLVAGWGLLAAVRTVVLPRGDVNLLTRAVFFTTGKLFRLLASERREYVARDRVMALYAPVSLVLLPFAWAFTVAIGFTLMFWALGGRTWFEAFSLSGSSLLTLGFVPAESFRGPRPGLRRGDGRSWHRRSPHQLSAHHVQQLQPARAGGGSARGPRRARLRR